ncbi:MAG: G5 domain-containing protein [Firmicutes bacterium]|nr:G5 domain-containing protein [Bacillota bacterium]
MAKNISESSENSFKFKNTGNKTVIFPLHPDNMQAPKPKLSPQLKQKAASDPDIADVVSPKSVQARTTSPRREGGGEHRTHPTYRRGASSTGNSARMPVRRPKRRPTPKKKGTRLTGGHLLSFVAILVILLIVGIIGFRKNAQAVILNGETVGYIKKTTTTEEDFKKLIEAKLGESLGNTVYVNEDITLKPVSSLFKNIPANPEKVVTKVCDAVTYKQAAVSLTLGDQPAIILANSQQADEALAGALKKYKAPEGQYTEGAAPEGHSNPEFAVAITKKDVQVDGSQVLTLDEAIDKLARTQQVSKIHTVVSGETFAGIAQNAGMTESELYAANPSVIDGSRLSVGTKLNINTIEPVIPVRTYAVVTTTQTIDYETKHEYLPDKPVYYENVKQEGKEGQKSIYTCTPYVNGEVEGQPIVSETVTAQPVTRILQEGTGEELED